MITRRVSFTLAALALPLCGGSSPGPEKMRVVLDAELEQAPPVVSRIWLQHAIDRVGTVERSLGIEGAEAEFVMGEVPSGSGHVCRLTFRFESFLLNIVALSWRTSSSSEHQVADARLDALAQISEAGFLNEYLWTYARDPQWVWNPSNGRLQEFKKWAQAKLQGELPLVPIEISHSRCPIESK